jgi:hypothetical protein
MAVVHISTAVVHSCVFRFVACSYMHKDARGLQYCNKYRAYVRTPRPHGLRTMSRPTLEGQATLANHAGTFCGRGAFVNPACVTMASAGGRGGGRGSGGGGGGGGGGGRASPTSVTPFPSAPRTTRARIVLTPSSTRTTCGAAKAFV